MSSWNLFDSPGSGFESHDKSYFRLTAFGIRDNTVEVIEII